MWASLWRGVVTGGRPVAGNLANEDTLAWSRGDLGEEGADWRAPSGRLARKRRWAGRLARTRRWAGVGTELGRPRKKRPTMIFPIE
jgi:hypothetical protein